MSALAKRVAGSRYARNIATVFTANVLAQAVPLAVAPVLTRLYEPAEFGTFAVYVGAIALIASAATGRYELAIMLPPTARRAFSVAALTLAITLASCTLLLAATPFAAGLVPTWVQEEGHAGLVYLVPFGVLASALFQTLNYWTVYQGGFRTLGAAKITQTSATASAQLVAGSLGGGVGSLLAGHVIGFAVSVGVLGGRFLAAAQQWLPSTSVKDLLAVATRYRRFPLLSLPADTTNVLSNQAPVFLLGALFGPTAAGLYALTQRVVGAPIGIVASSVLDVFRERAAREFRERGNCVAAFGTTFRALAALGIVPFSLLFLYSPGLFALVFGEEWREAGEYARLLVPMFFLRFVASPLSYVLYVAEKQSYDLLWQIALLVGTLTAIWAGAQLGDARLAVGLFSGCYSGLYLVYLWLSYHFARGGGP